MCTPSHQTLGTHYLPRNKGWRLHDAVAVVDPGSEDLGEDLNQQRNSPTPVRRYCESLTGAAKYSVILTMQNLSLTETAGQCAAIGVSNT